MTTEITILVDHETENFSKFYTDLKKWLKKESEAGAIDQAALKCHFTSDTEFIGTNAS